MGDIQLQDKFYQVGCGSFYAELNACISSFLSIPVDNIIPVDDYNNAYSNSDCIPHNAETFVSIGEPKNRQKAVSSLSNRKLRFPNVISPKFDFIGESKLGKGNYFLGYGSLSAETVMADHCIVHGFSVIGHHCLVGSFVNVGAGSFVGGNCVIEDNVLIGPNATILPGVKIGANAVIAAGSVVLRNVKPNSSVYGNPARKF